MSSRAASGALNDLLTDDEEGYSLVERQAESPTSTSAAGEAAAIDSLADAANAAASALIGNEECSVEAKKEEESPSCFPGAAHAPTRVSVDLAPSAGKALVAEDSEGDGVEDDGPVLVEDAPASPSEAPATSTDAPAADKLSSPDMAPRSLSEPKACEASIQEALDAFVKGMREALPPRTLEYAGVFAACCLILLCTVIIPHAYVARQLRHTGSPQSATPEVQSLLIDLRRTLHEQQRALQALQDAARSAQHAQHGSDVGTVETVVERAVASALASLDLGGSVACSMESEWLACETAAQRMEAQMQLNEAHARELQLQLGQCQGRLQWVEHELEYIRIKAASAANTTDTSQEGTEIPTAQSDAQAAPAGKRKRLGVRVTKARDAEGAACSKQQGKKPRKARDGNGDASAAKGVGACDKKCKCQAQKKSQGVGRGDGKRNGTCGGRSDKRGGRLIDGDNVRDAVTAARQVLSGTLRAAADVAASAARATGDRAAAARAAAERASREALGALQSHMSASAEQLGELHRTLSGPVLQQLRGQWESVQAGAQEDARAVQAKAREAAKSVHARLKEAKHRTKKGLKPVEKLVKDWVRAVAG